MHSNSTYAVIDLETTGFGSSDGIIEVGVVLLNDRCDVEKTWETLVQPHRDVPNTFVHHISATDLVDAPAFENIAGELATLLNGRTVIAHNASFEVRFLKKEFSKLGVEFPAYGAWILDTMRLFGFAYPEHKRSLGEALRVTGLNNERPHTALADAQATADLFAFLASLENGPSINGTSLKLPEFAYPESHPAVPRERVDSEWEDPGAWLARLANNLPSIGEPNAERYRSVLTAALADKKLVKTEIKQLEEQAKADRIPHSDLLLIHEEFIRQLAVEAWMDGVITPEERTMLQTVSAQLGFGEDLANELLATRQYGESKNRISLSAGDRITLTGQMDLPRDEWEKRAISLGFDVGGVTKKSKLLVAANPDSRSGKAKKARELHIPIIGEQDFAQLIQVFKEDVEKPEPNLSEASSAANVQEAADLYGRIFPWLEDLIADAEYNPSPTDISHLWIKEFSHLELFQVSPVLNRTSTLDLDTGSTVDKRWSKSFPEPLNATVQDLQQMKGVGSYRLLTMVERVVLSALDSDPNLHFPERVDTFIDFYGEEDQNTLGSSGSSDWEESRGIAEDEVLLLTGWTRLVQRDVEKLDIPVDLKNRASNLYQLLEKRDPIAELFQAAIAALEQAAGDDARKQAVIRDRWAGNSTLDELGTAFNITRERIRQLESQTKKKFDEQRELFDAVVEAIAEKIGLLTRVEQLLDVLPALVKKPQGWESTYNDIFQGVSGRWVVDNGWAMSPDFLTRFDAALDKHADDYGLALIADVARELGIRAEVVEEFVTREETNRRIILGEHVATRVGSHQDRAVTVLALHGEPMTIDDIFTTLGSGSQRSAGNQYAIDDRLIRVSAGKWALSEWNLEEFNSIVEWMGRRVDAGTETVQIADGEEATGVKLSDLLGEAERLEVSANSMKQYASGNDFQVVGGVVVRRVDEFNSDSVNSLDETKDMVLRNGHWNLLVDVDFDHLRGSGFGAARSLAVHFGATPDKAAEFTSRLGEQFVRLNRLGQASISTMKRFLDDLGAKEGDRVFLKFGDDRSFDVAMAPKRVKNPEGIVAVYDALGISTDSLDDSQDASEQLVPVNEVLGLDPNAPRRRTVALFRHRRQDDLADIVQGL